MKTRRKFMFLILGLLGVLLLLLILNFNVYLHRDRVSPVFRYDSEVLILNEKQVAALKQGDDSILLQGIHALDDVDGDLTRKIFIQNKEIMYDGLYMVVTYRVVDEGNNIANGYRIVYLMTPKKVEETVLTKYLGFNPFEEKKTKSNEPPVLRVQDYVIIERGESFNPTDYVLELSDDNDSTDQLVANAVMTGSYDIYRSGIYVLVFYTIDSDKNMSTPATLTLYVK